MRRIVFAAIVVAIIVGVIYFTRSPELPRNSFHAVGDDGYQVCADGRPLFRFVPVGDDGIIERDYTWTRDVPYFGCLEEER